MAQNNAGIIEGQLTSEGHLFADTVSVVLFSAVTNGVVRTTSSNNRGTYVFSGIKPGEYIIGITRPGYANYRSNSFTVTKTLFRMPVIDLKPSYTGLKEVTIINKKLFIEAHPDKTILNISRGIITTGTSVLDVLATAPGLKVDGNDALTYRGGQPPLVVIDGKNTHLSIQDVQMMLRNMPSGDVETIELYSSPPARFDAQGTGGVINIITKKGRSQGLNGSATAGGGYGNYGKANAGLNLNYRAKAVNVFGQVSGGDNKSNQQINTDRKIGAASEFDSRYTTHLQLFNPAYRLGADFFIDSTHTVGVLFNGFTNIIDFGKNNRSVINNVLLPDTNLNTQSGMSRRISLANYNINYTGRLGKTQQTLSADLDYSLYSRTSDEEINSQLINLSNSANNRNARYHNYASTAYKILSGKTDYTSPLAGGNFGAGLKASYVKSNNVQQFVEFAPAVTFPDEISSEFVYRDRTLAAYTDYSGRTGNKKIDYAVGLRIENRWMHGATFNNDSVVARNFTNLFPQVKLNFKLSKHHSLQVGYNRRMDQPMYEDLNPIIAIQDRYNFRQGNPFLLPAYENAFQITHTYKGKTFVGFSYSHISNFFSFVYFRQNDARKTFVTTKENLKSAVNYMLTFNTSLEPAPWWDANFDAYVSYQRYKDYAGQLDKHAFDALAKLTNQFSLPKGFHLLLYGQYEVPTDYTIYYYKASYFVKAAINKKLLHNRATIALSADDIFNTDRDRYSSTYMNLDMVGYSKRETRRVMVSFTYQFGKSTVKASRKHVNGDDEEQKRISNSQ